MFKNLFYDFTAGLSVLAMLLPCFYLFLITLDQYAARSAPFPQSPVNISFNMQHDSMLTGHRQEAISVAINKPVPEVWLNSKTPGAIDANAN